jgi:hypothetical protein
MLRIRNEHGVRDHLVTLGHARASGLQSSSVMSATHDVYRDVAAEANSRKPRNSAGWPA